MVVNTEIYDYTHRMSVNMIFPKTDEEIEKLMNAHSEITVQGFEGISLDGDFGMNVREFNDLIRLFTEEDIDLETVRILSRTYLIAEIAEAVKNGVITIIDFDDATSGWSSASIWDDSDKGRVLYDEGIASFPAEVPEALEPYMDYAMLWRDSEVNMNLRVVSTDKGNYIVSLSI